MKPMKKIARFQVTSGTNGPPYRETHQAHTNQSLSKDKLLMIESAYIISEPQGRHPDISHVKLFSLDSKVLNKPRKVFPKILMDALVCKVSK